MSTVIVSVRGGDRFVDPDVPQSVDGFPELARMQEAWRTRAYPSYTLTRGWGFPVERVEIEFEPVPGEGEFVLEYSFDDSFLNQLITSYAHFGWSPIALLKKKLAHNSTPITPAARSLFDESRSLLVGQIADTLANLETQLSQFARQNWTATIDGLAEWRKTFTRYSQHTSRLADRRLADKIFALLMKYDANSKKTEDLESKRKAVDHAGSYEPGKNDDTHPDLYRAYGKEEIELRASNLDLAGALFRIFPPALFVLNDLGVLRRKDTTTFKGRRLIASRNQSDIENKIAERIDENIEGLRSVIAELDQTSQCQDLSRDMASAADGVERLVARRCTDTFDRTVRGAGNVVLAVATPFVMPFVLTQWDSLQGLSANPVLGYAGVVNQFWARIVRSEPQSWRRVVLQSYQNALGQELRSQAIREAKIAFAIRVFKWVEGAISILAFMVLIVATDGALLAVGVPLICSVISTTASILGIAFLAVTALELKIIDNANKAEWRDALLTLSLEDIDTVNAVGTALGRLEVYRRAIGVEVVKLLIKLALAKANASLVEKYQLSTDLNVAQHALDLENLCGDLETITQDTGLVLYSPVPRPAA